MVVAPGEDYCKATKCENDGQEKQDIAGRHGIPPFIIGTISRNTNINVVDLGQFAGDFPITKSARGVLFQSVADPPGVALKPRILDQRFFARAAPSAKRQMGPSHAAKLANIMDADFI